MKSFLIAYFILMFEPFQLSAMENAQSTDNIEDTIFKELNNWTPKSTSLEIALPEVQNFLSDMKKRFNPKNDTQKIKLAENIIRNNPEIRVALKKKFHWADPIEADGTVKSHGKTLWCIQNCEDPLEEVLLIKSGLYVPFAQLVRHG